jgi:hypothetical protein
MYLFLSLSFWELNDNQNMWLLVCLKQQKLLLDKFWSKVQHNCFITINWIFFLIMLKMKSQIQMY